MLTRVKGFTVVMAVLALSACAASPPPAGVGAGSDFLFSALKERTGAVDFVVPERHLHQVLPNRLVAIGGAEPSPLVQGVVIGEVEDVTPGAAFLRDADGETAWDDPEAEVRLFRVEVAVEHAWGQPSGLEHVAFAIVVNGSADAQRTLTELSSLGRIIVVLEHQGSLSFDPAVYRIRAMDTYLGLVADDDTVSFPLVA